MLEDLTSYAIKVGVELFSLRDVQGDGNCFYRAICSHHNFQGMDHSELRRELVSKLRIAFDEGGALKDGLEKIHLALGTAKTAIHNASSV